MNSPAATAESWNLKATLYRIGPDGTRSDFDLFEQEPYPHPAYQWHVDLAPPTGVAVDALDYWQAALVTGRADGRNFEDIADGLPTVCASALEKRIGSALNRSLGSKEMASTLAKLTALGLFDNAPVRKVRASQRQAQVLGAAALGIPYVRLPPLLGISQSMVNAHVSRICDKLDAHTRRTAVHEGFRAGILTTDWLTSNTA